MRGLPCSTKADATRPDLNDAHADFACTLRCHYACTCTQSVFVCLSCGCLDLSGDHVRAEGRASSYVVPKKVRPASWIGCMFGLSVKRQQMDDCLSTVYKFWQLQGHVCMVEGGIWRNTCFSGSVSIRDACPDGTNRVTPSPRSAISASGIGLEGCSAPATDGASVAMGAFCSIWIEAPHHDAASCGCRAVTAAADCVPSCGMLLACSIQIPA